MCTFVPFMMMHSSSEILSWDTSSACPRDEASNFSSPFKSDKELTSVAPVALAILRRSSFLHLRTAMAPFSINSLSTKSSIPFVVKTTFAPALRIISTRSVTMPISRCLICSSCLGSSIVICTPSFIRSFCKFISKHAILASGILVFIACEATVQFNAYPLIKTDSVELFPCALRTFTAFTGYLISFLLFVDFTDCIASTTILEKNSESAPIILLDIEVFAILMRDSLPRFSTLVLIFSFIYLTASRRANRYPVIIVVGCIRFLTSSLARRSSSAAIITTEVVPSPTCAGSARFLYPIVALTDLLVLLLR